MKPTVEINGCSIFTFTFQLHTYLIKHNQTYSEYNLHSLTFSVRHYVDRETKVRNPCSYCKSAQ